MRLKRDSSRYILVRQDGVEEDITDVIEPEINFRVKFQREIDRAHNHHERVASMESSTTKLRLSTMKRYLERVLKSSWEMVEAWQKGKELIGPAIRTKQDILMIEKWLKDLDT
jgi:hypothetical protein